MKIPFRSPIRTATVLTALLALAGCKSSASAPDPVPTAPAAPASRITIERAGNATFSVDPSTGEEYLDLGNVSGGVIHVRPGSASPGSFLGATVSMEALAAHHAGKRVPGGRRAVLVDGSTGRVTELLLSHATHDGASGVRYRVQRTPPTAAAAGLLDATAASVGPGEVLLACTTSCNVDAGTASSAADPPNFPLSSGTTTVTGPYPTANAGSCGSMGSDVAAAYPGFQMAAVPAKFFKTYNTALGTNGISCGKGAGDVQVVVDAAGAPLCFEISVGTQKKYAVVADVCAGNCASNAASCETATDVAADCKDSVSCLDCPNAEKQFSPKWRCPPVTDCYAAAHQGSPWQDYTGSFYASTCGIDGAGTTQCIVDGFIPSGKYPYSFMDWCSGENPHFDLQTDPLSPSNVVATYRRLPDCKIP